MAKDEPDKFDIFVQISVTLMIAGSIFLFFRFHPGLGRKRNGGQYTQCQSNCKNMGTALEMYYVDNEEKFPQALTMLTPDYLRIIPTCSGSVTNKGYIDSYNVSGDFKIFTFYCKGKNHTSVGVGENYPQFNSREGLIPFRKRD